MGWLDSLQRRSLENPKTSLSNPAEWLYNALGARQAASGVTVTPETALEVSAVWAAVRMISSAVASLPLPVYQHTSDGKTKARQHPHYKLLHDRPNPEQSAFVFRETMQAHLLLYGNCYAEIVRNALGFIVELWPIHPANVTAKRDKDGKKFYAIRVNGQEVNVTAESILHISGFSLDGSTGLIPTTLARNSIGLAKATEDFGSKFFSNGASLSGALTHPGKLGAEARENLRGSFNNLHAGLTNAQRVAVLEEGMTWTPLGVPPEHAQFLETRKFQVTEVARVFQIPPHMLADLERATFSNIEHQAIEYVTHCIAPWCRRWESELNYRLFDDDPDYFSEFNLDGLLRGDSASRAAFYSSLFQIGVLSPNEIRAKENLNAIEGGDRRFIPLNMASLDNVPAPDVVDAVRSLIDTEIGRFRRRKEKHKDADDGFLQRQHEILTENLTPLLRSYFDLTNQTDNPADHIRRIITEDDYAL